MMYVYFVKFELLFLVITQEMNAKVGNIREFIVKSIITRNEHRDVLFRKYKEWYQITHCSVCDGNFVDLKAGYIYKHKSCSVCHKKMCADNIPSGMVDTKGLPVEPRICCVIGVNYLESAKNTFCTFWCKNCAPICHICNGNNLRKYITKCVSCYLWCCGITCFGSGGICMRCHERLKI